MNNSLVTSVLGNVMNSDIMKGIQQQKIKDKRMIILDSIINYLMMMIVEIL